MQVQKDMSRENIYNHPFFFEPPSKLSKLRHGEEKNRRIRGGCSCLGICHLPAESQTWSEA
jgi:hypothetical protein